MAGNSRKVFGSHNQQQLNKKVEEEAAHQNNLKDAIANNTTGIPPTDKENEVSQKLANDRKRANDKGHENSGIKVKKSRAAFKVKTDQEKTEVSTWRAPMKKGLKEASGFVKQSLPMHDPTKTIESKVRGFSLNEDSDYFSAGKAVEAVDFSCSTSDLSKSRDQPIAPASGDTSTDLIELKCLNVVEGPVTVKTDRDLAIDFSNPHTYYLEPPSLPDNVEDFDKSQVKDLNSEPHYAHDVFEYFRELEVATKVRKYIDLQPNVTKMMRAVLVDWMVEVQESFELNHETLYLAVKIVDHYLMVKKISKEKFQLLGATSIFIAAKFDERIPPAIEDFLYICDDAYQRRDVIMMEIEVLKRLKFFIGFPISYRFLRRYARCAKMSMETLTLARYILEMSQMEYELIETRDSEIAAAALLLALRMKGYEWSPTLEFYTGCDETKLIPLMLALNTIISAPPKPTLKTIRTKYSHSIFFSVAKIAPLPARKLSTV